MGRPAKPTRLKVLHGDREDRINRDEPTPGAAEIVAPDWLGPEALAVWDRLAPDLIAQGVMTGWDVPAFAIVCDAAALYERALEQVNREGLAIKGTRGTQVRHPLLQVMRDATATYTSLAGRFGLTPADRTRLSVVSRNEPGGPERLLS